MNSFHMTSSVGIMKRCQKQNNQNRYFCGLLRQNRTIHILFRCEQRNSRLRCIRVNRCSTLRSHIQAIFIFGETLLTEESGHIWRNHRHRVKHCALAPSPRRRPQVGPGFGEQNTNDLTNCWNMAEGFSCNVPLVFTSGPDVRNKSKATDRREWSHCVNMYKWQDPKSWVICLTLLTSALWLFADVGLGICKVSKSSHQIHVVEYKQQQQHKETQHFPLKCRKSYKDNTPETRQRQDKHTGEVSVSPDAGLNDSWCDSDL